MVTTTSQDQAEASVPTRALGELLAREEYVRHRVDPRWRDIDYLLLRDLHQAISSLAQRAHGCVFDYGCGAAPYRGLFRHCEKYVAADVTPGPNIDKLLESDGLTRETSESYDLVLSTQVLEHVKDPDAYVRECCRILKPGGQLFLSTHGMIEEHGCPYDFYRWTSNGLEALVSKHGLRIVESLKLTTEMRAMAQLLHQLVDHLRCPAKPFWRFVLAFLRRCYGRICVPALNAFVDRFPQQAVIPASDPATLYVGVSVRAEKPLTGCG